MSSQNEQTTKVGVLLVHGVGEQRQFQHIDEVVRNLALALTEHARSSSALVNIRTTLDGAYGANQQTWRSADEAPVFIEVVDSSKHITEIHFTEVWWADLDEPSTLFTNLQFWWWGLSIWTVKPLIDPEDGGYQRTRPPLKKRKLHQTPDCTNFTDEKNRPLPNLFIRLRLFWVALVIFLVLPVLAFFSWLLRPLGIRVPIDVISQFIGDVKLYQQKKRQEKGPLWDLGLPPRVTIRRRIVEGLVKMATRDYERWYILAHSQGTVVALNGLMEIEQALPNYLSKELWEHVKSKLGKHDPRQPFETLVPRPGWLKDHDAIDRRKLFSGLKGILTYGSPLKKFAVFWPATVPLNQDEVDDTKSPPDPVFSKDTEWINVYDPTDPVASATKYFHPCTPEGLTPKDFSYKTQLIHLLSHTQYLTFERNKPNLLVNQVATWLLDGKAFTRPQSLRWLSPFLNNFLAVVRVLIWLAAAFTISVLLSHLIPFGLSLMGVWKLDTITLKLLGHPLFYVVSAFTIVFVVGVLNLIFRSIGQFFSDS